MSLNKFFILISLFSYLISHPIPSIISSTKITKDTYLKSPENMNKNETLESEISSEITSQKKEEEKTIKTIIDQQVDINKNEETDNTKNEKKKKRKSNRFK